MATGGFDKSEKTSSDVIEISGYANSPQNLACDQNRTAARIGSQSSGEEDASEEDISNVNQNVDKISEHCEHRSSLCHKNERTETGIFHPNNIKVVPSQPISRENNAQVFIENAPPPYNDIEVNDVDQVEGSLTLKYPASPIRSERSNPVFLHKHKLPRVSKKCHQMIDSKLDCEINALRIHQSPRRSHFNADIPVTLAGISSTSHAGYIPAGNASTEMNSQPIGAQAVASVNEETIEESNRTNEEPVTGQYSAHHGRFSRNLDVMGLENDMKANLDECLKKYEESKVAIDRIRSQLRDLGEFSEDFPSTSSNPLAQRDHVSSNLPTTVCVPLSQPRQASRHPITQLKERVNQLTPPPSYEECMLWASPCYGQTGQGEGGLRLDKPPDYRTRQSLCCQSSEFYHPEYYTRFISQPRLVDSSVRRPRPRQTLQRRDWALAMCPCLSQELGTTSDHMVLSLLSFVLCWPIGFAAMYYSHMCQKNKRIGNYAKAQNYSNSAFATGMVGVVFGVFSLFTVYVHKKGYI